MSFSVGEKVQCTIIYNELFGEEGVIRQVGSEKSVVNFGGKEYICNNVDLRPLDEAPAVVENAAPRQEEPAKAASTKIEIPDFVQQNRPDPEAAFQRKQSAERHLKEWMAEVSETDTWGMAESTQNLYGIGKEAFEAIITAEGNTACGR